MSEISIHPAAMLFPMMGEEEVTNLAEDIAANGLLEPIIIFNGEVLDGRNRMAACQLAGVEPQFAEVDGVVLSPTLYVISKNLHRRHLTTSQRGAVAADMVPLLEDEAHKRQISAGTANITGKSVPIGTDLSGRSRTIAAAATHVGEGTVTRSLEVKKRDPRLFEKIKSGEITANAAKNQLPSGPKKDLVSLGTKSPYEPKTDGQKKKAEGQKQRMVSALSTIASLCRGLNEELDLRVAISVCSNEDITTWASHARDAAKHLRTFTSNLERNT